MDARHPPFPFPNMSQKILRVMLPLVLLVSLLAGCDPGLPTGSSGFSVGGAAAPLSQAEFNALPPQTQYQVANKLYGTLFRGITADAFFDLDAGFTSLKPRNDNFINDTRHKLATDLSLAERAALDKAIDGLDENGNPDPARALYVFDTRADLENNGRPKQLPLARIKTYPISRDLYVHWMAYFLANTIMYSPAEEMESTDMLDVQRMFRFLVTSIKEKKTIRQMIRANLPSLARWRVSRSPENQALEAFELYLGLLETGNPEALAKSPVLRSLPDSIEKGGIACKDRFLTSAADNYLISSTDFPNTTPQLILTDSFIVSCDDLYDVVAGHSLVIPRAVEVIINYFMPGPENAERRQAMSEAIVQANPQTYEDIFTAILFSKEYLLNVERPKSFEESFIPMLDRLKWSSLANVGNVNKRIFQNMATNTNSRIYLGSMGWDDMSLKIGRIPNVPLDALSFANYHKALREKLFYEKLSYIGGFRDAGEGLINDATGNVLPFIENLSLGDYIDYIFLNAVNRKASQVEKDDLTDFFVNVQNYTKTVDGQEVIRPFRYDEIASETLDYISRLPELYYFQSVNP